MRTRSHWACPPQFRCSLAVSVGRCTLFPCIHCVCATVSCCFVCTSLLFNPAEDDVVRKTTLREVKILRMLKHRCVVDLREAFRRKGKLYLVFEYMENNLLEVLEENPNGLDPETVRRYVFQLCLAIEFCHRNGVIHRGPCA